MAGDTCALNDTSEIRSYQNCNKLSITADTPITRVYKAKYLCDLVENRSNTLVPIDKWDDPFEAFLFKQKIRDGRIVGCFGDSFKNCYGQCWSLNTRETDATWRIYSPEKNGILVKSTFGKLWDGFCADRDKEELAGNKLLVDKVDYYEQDDIVREFKGKSVSELLIPQMTLMHRSLFIKRCEFMHEKEVRIIYDGVNKPLCDRYYSYAIDPADFIEELIADPRMDDCLFFYLEDRFKKCSLKISKSKLYKLPDLELKL